jgi:D-alanyl-D-alanine carboxypeptidase (penicillin-binding protein 5/6)
MGCPTDRSRATETTRLLSYGFNLYRQVTLVATAGQPVDGTAEVDGGKKAELALVYADPLQVAVPRDRETDIQLRRELAAPVTAPVAQGEKVGEAVAELDGYELGRVDLLAGETVEKGNWWHRLFH